MSPRPPEPFAQFRERLLQAVAAGANEVRFGSPEQTHAICREADGWSLRRLAVSEKQIREAFGNKPFYPEQLEAILKPATIEVTAVSLDDLLAFLKPRWIGAPEAP